MNETTTIEMSNVSINEIIIKDLNIEKQVTALIFLILLVWIFVLGLSKKSKKTTFYFPCFILSLLTFFSALCISTLEIYDLKMQLMSTRLEYHYIEVLPFTYYLIYSLFISILVTCIGFIFTIILYIKTQNK